MPLVEEDKVDVYDSQPLSFAFACYARDVIAFRNQSRKTEEHHNVTLKSLISFMGRDIPLSELTFDKVREWKLDMEKRNLSPETIRGYLVRLRVVLNYLRYKGVDCLDPSNVPLPKRSSRVPGVLTPEEVQRLIDATSKLRNKAIISLLYSTGLRVNELCHLNRKDVEEDCFNIVGKGGKDRLCFIDARSRQLLNEYLARRNGYDVFCQYRGKTTSRLRYHVDGDNNPALFISDSGQRITPSTVQNIFKFARVKAGFDWPVHPHTLRHSFATNLMKNGAHIYAIKELMGHARLDTTSQYLHIFNPELKRVHDQFHSV